ncbi:DUF4465 domain-containing protein [Niabella sp. 22666]|uniref:DUF4465 domain-containing protein n=1 Tax=Niabella sp. 22666 TaxID=3453954 RepID=UPI003F87780D
MKLIKNNLFAFGLLLSLFSACSDKKEVLIPLPEDITFNELPLDRFSYKTYDAPFKAGTASTGTITVNAGKNADGSFKGFALSNKNWRSYPWNLSPDFAPPGLSDAQKKASVDSCIFSVFTNYPNKTENFLVADTRNGEAYITLDQPAVVEHILVANTTYNHLLETYGSNYSGTLNTATQEYSLTGTKIRNIKIASTSTDLYGRWYLPGPDNKNLIRLEGIERLAQATQGAQVRKGFVKLIVTGSKTGTTTGKVEFWLAVRPGIDPAKAAWNVILGDWYTVDLKGLGQVDRLQFDIDSDYKDTNGKVLVPPYFCLDGIRIQQ